MRESEINEQKQILIERLKGGIAALRIENPKLSDKDLVRILLQNLPTTRRMIKKLNITLNDIGVTEVNYRYIRCFGTGKNERPR